MWPTSKPNLYQAVAKQQYIMSDLERWRQLFREEAQRCVQELRDVVDGRGPARCGVASLVKMPGVWWEMLGDAGEELLLQLEAQRKSDQAETASLRNHVEVAADAASRAFKQNREEAVLGNAWGKID
eukprot:Skav205486  [mRNA]  locus=scaffold830:452606:457999:- [translate_table: standard]